jgi:copper resistance protein B
MQHKAMIGLRASWLIGALVFDVSPGWAQTPATGPESMPGMDHRKMGHGSALPSKETADRDAAQTRGMDHGSMQGGDPPPDARDPHAWSGGYTLDPARPLRLADEHYFGSLLVDSLEAVRTRHNTFMAYDVQAWFGRTYDRAVFKSEGEVDGGRLEDARTELLWGHAIAAYWDAQIGVRHDSGEGPSRSWLAFGLQGLAPYWFELDAAVYLGEGGRSALRLDAEYELLLTQKLVLQPKFETSFYGRSDAERGRGSGLADASVALRLRYEIRREFAPYVGVEWSRKFGETEDLARAAGEDARQTRYLAGLRFWF